MMDSPFLPRGPGSPGVPDVPDGPGAPLPPPPSNGVTTFASVCCQSGLPGCRTEGSADGHNAVPPRDGKGFTISGNLKTFQGPVLKCRGSRKHRAFYLNGLVIHEIRNNASVFSEIFFLPVVK